MKMLCVLWNPIVVFVLASFFKMSICDSQNSSQRYPFVLPRCCERDEIQSPYAIATESRELNLQCVKERPDVVVLPKHLFPSMPVGLQRVEVKLRNSVFGLECSRTQDYTYFSIDLGINDNSTNFSVDGGKDMDKVAFSGNNFLAPDRNIYSPRQFCVSSSTMNMNRLVIKTCNRKCTPQTPCVPRCCGGHQSVLTSLPASHNESLLDFCSTPFEEKNLWNPRTSSILETDPETRFSQTTYGKDNQEGRRRSVSQGNCKLLHITELMLDDRISLALLRDGRLLWRLENTTKVLDNFCIDGLSGVEGTDISEDFCMIPKQEILVLYFCEASASMTTQSIAYDEKDIISLPACFCLTRPYNSVVKLPSRLFAGGQNETRNPVPVKLTTRENAARLTCPNGYKDLYLEFRDVMGELIKDDGSLILQGLSHNQTQFCIQSVFHNALGLRVCQQEEEKESFLIFSYLGAGLLSIMSIFYMAIAGVYILRSDKEPIFRCSIVCSSISMAIGFFITICKHMFLDESPYTVASFIIGSLGRFCHRYGFSWMSVLCFDIWLHITFLSPGKRSVKRLWGYVTFTLAFPTMLIGSEAIRVHLDDNDAASNVLGFLEDGLLWGLICINFFLFLATAVKLWVAQHSADIKNQKNTFLLYFKLFILMGLRWVIDVFFFLPPIFSGGYETLKMLGQIILTFLHPIVLFDFLVWDAETKGYLETNYPRIKKIIDFIFIIGYPVRKCWGLCCCCCCRKNPREETNSSRTEGAPLCSTHMYVHKSRIPRTRN